MRVARKETPESRAYGKDQRAREKHVKDSMREFRKLYREMAPVFEQAQALEDTPKKQGRVLVNLLKQNALVSRFLEKFVGNTSHDRKAESWRSQIIYQLRNLYTLPDYTQKKALIEVAKQASKGFLAMSMAESQAPLREVLPTEIRDFLPKNIVVDVDESGSITRITDRFENEFTTLEIKIKTQHRLIKEFNKIAKRVKKDLKSSNEVIKLSALVTSILMETGIRPGKAGNAAFKRIDGKKVEIETFGAITLGPRHVTFIRKGFVTLEFIGKKGGKNIASLSDSAVLKVLQHYVDRAVTKKSPFVFVTTEGVRFTYTDLQRYFNNHFKHFSPTDFRKLKATQTVMENLHDMQQDLYREIREFADTETESLRQRIVEAVTRTVQKAYEQAQQALSHESVKTTIHSYVNPEVLLRFLSTGSVADTIESAVMDGTSTLSFNADLFLEKAMKTSSTRHVRHASLRSVMEDLETSMEESGNAPDKTAHARMARTLAQQFLDVPSAQRVASEFLHADQNSATDQINATEEVNASVAFSTAREAATEALSHVTRGPDQEHMQRALVSALAASHVFMDYLVNTVPAFGWEGIQKDVLGGPLASWKNDCEIGELSPDGEKFPGLADGLMPYLKEALQEYTPAR